MMRLARHFILIVFHRQSNYPLQSIKGAAICHLKHVEQHLIEAVQTEETGNPE